MIDLDHFKRINDTHGHRAGDAVLIAAARVCRSMLRDTDILGRYGGEEFAIIMPETNREEAHEVAERLRLAVAELVVPWGDIALTITTSVGVAVVDNGANTIAELLDHADQALYAAKRAGRNRVVVFTEDTPAAD
jgi:diguanylate cyclase (GGDEF)-like protein